MIDEVVTCFYTSPCPNEKAMTKHIDGIIDIFLKEGAIDLENVKKMMYYLEDPTSDMRCTLFLLSKCFDLSHVRQHQSGLRLDQQNRLGAM